MLTNLTHGHQCTFRSKGLHFLICTLLYFKAIVLQYHFNDTKPCECIQLCCSIDIDSMHKSPQALCELHRWGRQ